MQRPGLRFVPLLGVAFVVLVVVGFLVAGDTPDVKALGAKVRSDYDDETKHQVSAYLVALGAVAFLFFGSYWRSLLGRLHPTSRTSARAAQAGVIVAATGLGVSSLIHSALAEGANKVSFSDPALQALNALDNWSFYPFALGFSTFALASGVALLRGRRLFPSWIAWTAVVLGLLGLTPIAGFFAALALAVWVIVVSLMAFSRFDALETMAPAA